MKRTVLSVLFISLALALCASCGRPRIISEKKFKLILEDILMAGQWLKDNSSERRKADTTWYYDPIFEEHGCRFKDFDASLSHYMKNPEHFEEMTKDVFNSLELKRKDLEFRINRDEILQRILSSTGGYETKEFTYLYNPRDTVYELFGKVRLQDGLDTNVTDHPIDSVGGGELVHKGDSAEMLLPDGPHESSLKRHKILNRVPGR